MKQDTRRNEKQLMKVSVIGVVLMISFLNLNIGFNSGSTNFDLNDVKIMNNASASESDADPCNGTELCDKYYTTKISYDGLVWCCGKYNAFETGYKSH